MEELEKWVGPLDAGILFVLARAGIVKKKTRNSVAPINRSKTNKFLYLFANMAVDLISLVGIVVILVVILGVAGIGYQWYEQDEKNLGLLMVKPPSTLAVLPPMTGPPAPPGTTPTGLPHDPLVDYWDDPAINFPGAPTKPIPPGMTALCQNDCYCPWLFPSDPYGLADFNNRTAAEMQQTAIKVKL